MSAQFVHLFSPFRLGNLTLRNRIVFQPHFTALADDDGMPSRKQAFYYAERAKGGAGLIIIENAAIHPTGKMADRFINAWDPRAVSGLQRIAEMVHAHDVPILGQLNHGGHTTLYRPPQILWAPTQMPEPSCRYVPKEMEPEDIRATVGGFARSAHHYIQAGFDGIEIKAAAHDGLLRSFVSAFFNRRNDAYAGSFENHMRLPIEVVAAVREAIGKDAVLGVRVCLDEFTPWGYSLEVGLEIVRALVSTGMVDYVNTDAGTFSSFYMEIPPAAVPLGYATYLGAAVKEAIGLPVIAFGRINDPVLAEQVLADGHADLIGMARPLIADPLLPSRARDGLLDEIGHCIACNDGCVGQASQEKNIRCVHNPAAGREEELGIGTLEPARERRRILVIGAGVAGLKVAEVAAARGHQVTIVEKAPEVGGQIGLAARQPFHQEIGDVPRHLAARLRRLGAEIRLGEEASVSSVLAAHADVVIVATGSRPSLPDVPGVGEAHVLTAHDVLRSRGMTGRRVVVVDWTGHWHGCGTAEYLLQEGNEVTLATPLALVGSELEPSNREMFYQRVFPGGMKLLPLYDLKAVDGGRVTLTHTYSGEERVLEGVDSVVLVPWQRSQDELYRALSGKVKALYRVGDCVAPRLLLQVTYEAELLARSL